MKNLILISFALLCFPLSAQQLIDNKGNRNQSYPIVTETKEEIVALLNQVSQDTIESHIQYMQGFYRLATSLNIAHLQKGTYLIVASTEQHRVARKLVIQ